MLFGIICRVYPSSPYSTGSGDRYGGDHESDLLLFPKPESLETKSHGTGQGTVMSVPKDAITAFRLLSESRVAQVLRRIRYLTS